MPQNLIGIETVSKQLGISVNTVYAWICQKRIPYVKIGRLVKFDQRDIDAWVESRKIKPFEY